MHSCRSEFLAGLLTSLHISIRKNAKARFTRQPGQEDEQNKQKARDRHFDAIRYEYPITMDIFTAFTFFFKRAVKTRCH